MKSGYQKTHRERLKVDITKALNLFLYRARVDNYYCAVLNHPLSKERKVVPIHKIVSHQQEETMPYSPDKS